jgi:NADPH:quinone reductase-like Zn-dependent oxidoreductase
MNAIFTTATAIELAIGGLLYYKFQNKAIFAFGILILYKIYQRTKTNNDTFMKAALYDPKDFNNVRVHSIPVPKCGKKQVLVKVKGASINPIDYKMQTAKIPVLRWFYPWTIGRDFSGIIKEVGENVRNFRVGDEVYGNAKGGSLQEYTVAKPNNIAIKPTNTNYNEAASLPLAGCTSLQALTFFGPLTSEQKVLIIGASGGTGILGVQIAKSFGCKVYGVCSGRNAQLVTSVGCDVVYDYTKKDYLDDMRNEQFDLIYDTVTSPEDGDKELIYGRLLKPGNEGKYVTINGTKGNFLRGILKQNFKLPVERKNFHLHLLEWNTKDLETLAKLVEQKKVKPIIHEEVGTINDADIKRAFKELQSRRTVGKITFQL